MKDGPEGTPLLTGAAPDAAPVAGGSRPSAGLPRVVGVSLAVAVAYFASAKLGLAMSFVGGNVSAVWIPSGLGVAALLLGGLRLAPALWLGALAATAATGAPVLVAAGIATGNTTEYILAALLLRHLWPDGLRLERVTEVLGLTAAAVVFPAVAAVVGTASLCAGGVAPWAIFGDIVTTWWLGDSAGILLVTPFLLAWARGWRDRRGLPELALLCGLSLAAAWIVFGVLPGWVGDGHAAAYAVFPFLVWGALRHGVRGAASVAILVSIPAILYTASGAGLFVADSQTESLLLLQTFMAVVVLTALVTAAAVAERDRADSHRRLLDQAVDQAATAILITDSVGRLTYVNPAFTRLTGWPLDEVAGRTPAFLKSGHTDDGLYQDLWRTLLAGETWRGDFLNRTRDGGAVWMAATITPVRDADGTISHFVAAEEDVSARKAVEAASARALAETDRAKQELERVAYAVTHTLQEPLRAIGGFGQLLDRRYGGSLDEAGRGYLRHIVGSTERMQRLFRDLMDYALVDQAADPPEPVDLGAAAAAAVADLGAADRVTLAPLPTVPGHAHQLQNTLRHLIENALSFGAPGDTPPSASLSALREDGGWRVTVSDTGAGIAPEFHDRLFTLFSRLHTEEEVPGSGVGLAYCRRVAERHGGRIWLESEPGSGTRVHVWLPAGAAAPESTAP